MCKALANLTTTLSHHTIILGGDFQGNWTSLTTKDTNIRRLPYARWEGPTTPTFLPPSKPEQASCIDHITMWDPKGLATQSEPTLTIATSFLDHSEVLGKILLPLLITPPNPTVTTARTPRVPILKYPIAPHTLAA